MLDGSPDDVVERYQGLPALAAESDFGILDRNVVVVDTETTGLSFNHDELIQIAAAKLERGEIVDEAALLRARPKLGALVIDTWCNEPDVDQRLLIECDIATPHIAGYSYQGKQNGTAMAVRAVARRYGIRPLEDFYPETENLDLHPVVLETAGKSQGEVASMLQYNYPIFTDDFMFRTEPQGFEMLRSQYQYRREFYIE